MTTNKQPEETTTMKPIATNETIPTPAAPVIKRPDILTARKLNEYAKRHNLNADALRVITFLFMNGPQEPEAIIQWTGISYPKFFKALCNASGVIILDARVFKVDVNLTSRNAIKAIPESALTPIVKAEPTPVPVATVDPEPPKPKINAVPIEEATDAVATVAEAIAEEEVADAVSVATTPTTEGNEG